MSQTAATDAGPWSIDTGQGPLIATAIHAGHRVRPEAAVLLAIAADVRLREEDPFTDAWVGLADTTIVVHQSRFEFDLNRPRERAVYLSADDAWGLEVWAETLPDHIVEGSRRYWDAFYAAAQKMCDAAVAEHGAFVLLDMHSYNHRRGGPDAAVDDPEQNPEVNVGTESVTHSRWRPLIERFIADLSGIPFNGGNLDVRENVRFRGGHFPRWVNGRYGERGCALALEVKKFYMDEWTGHADDAVIGAIGEALEATIEGLRAGVQPR